MASSSSAINPEPRNSPNPPTSSPTPSLTTTRPSPTPSPHHPKPQDSFPHHPLSSSGRGFTPKAYHRPQFTDQAVNVAANGGGGGTGRGFPPRDALQFANQVRTFGGSNGQNHPLSMRPPSSQFGPRFMGGAGVLKTNSGVGNANKVQSPALGNGYRDTRDKNRNAVVTINHRKVRLSDDSSLYALCRSWVRNGLPKETQPQFGEGFKLLPRPLPMNVANSHIPEKSGSSDEDEEKEESSVEDLSVRELLQTHVKRAKTVRARLRKERLHRIERYKQRLALLLPSPVEQSRNNTSADI